MNIPRLENYSFTGENIYERGYGLEYSGLRYPVKDNEAEFVKKQNIKFKWKKGGWYYVDKEITE